MRIAISGSSSVGKSTLLKAIEEDNKFSSYCLIKEVVRSLILQGVKINKGADHVSQCRILQAHYDNVLKYRDMITDRCAVDAFVYATWDYLQGNYSYKEHKEHETIFLSCISTYQFYFYLKPEFPMQEDGVRDTDVSYQREIHELFLTIFQRYNIHYITLMGTVGERLRGFNKALGFYS